MTRDKPPPTVQMTAAEFRAFGRSAKTLDEWSRMTDAEKARHAPARCPTHAGPAVSRAAASAVPTERDGVRFGTKLEAELYDELRNRGSLLYRQVSFPLLCLAPKDETQNPRSRFKAETWTVDFVVVAPDGPWHVHEAKSPRVAESRDFRLRLNAFRASYPWVAVSIWRRESGRLKEECLWTP